MFFQLFDLKGNGRLSHVKQLSRFGEAQLFAYGVKYLKSAVCHLAAQI
jgi:hypothetical protein